MSYKCPKGVFKKKMYGTEYCILINTEENLVTWENIHNILKGKSYKAV